MENKNIVYMAQATDGGRAVWLLKFDYSKELFWRIKRISYIYWSAEKKCWVGPGGDAFKESVSSLQGVQVVVRKYQEAAIAVTAIGVRNKKQKPIPVQRENISPQAKIDFEKWKSYLLSRHYAESTIEVYANAMECFFAWLGETHHKEVRLEHVNNYMIHLVSERKASRSYHNQHVNAIKSFYKHTFSIHFHSDMLLRPRKEYKLPHYLTREEVAKVFGSLGNLKHRSMIGLVYACGLRLGETLRLRLTDIDASQRLIIIRQSKGNKDRVVPVPASILKILNQYATAFQPKVYLFEGQISGEPYSERSIQKLFKDAVRRSGIRQTEATLHWLRHSFATHLLEMGTNVRDLQALLGHKNLKTTEAYTHVSATNYRQIISPFDVLPDQNKKDEDEDDLPKKLYF